MRKIFFLIFSLLLLLNGCKKEVVIDPETAKQMIIHRNLGLAYLEEDNPGKAIEEFQTLNNIAPEELLGYANLGLAYLRIGELKQAETNLPADFKCNKDSTIVFQTGVVSIMALALNGGESVTSPAQ